MFLGKSLQPYLAAFLGQSGGGREIERVFDRDIASEISQDI